MHAVLQWFLSAAGILVLYLTMAAGVLLVPLGFAGEFVIVAAALVLILVAGSEVVGWWVFFFLLLLGVFAETVEFLAGLAGAKARGSLWSGIGALVGGIAGSVIGASFALVLGGVVGAFVGTFAGAFLVEWWICKHSGRAAQVAGAAFLARILASAVKVAVSIVMILVITLALVF